MTRPVRPEVSDPKLREALDRVGSHIENYHKNLDLISGDIKSIEQYLSNSGIRQYASAMIDISPWRAESEEALNENWFSGPVYREEQFIEWSADENDRWRVRYVKTRQAGSIDINDGVLMDPPSFEGGPEEIDRKPLIEAGAAIRLKAHRKLADLVESIGKAVEFEPMARPFTDDDIPA